MRRFLTLFVMASLVLMAPAYAVPFTELEASYINPDSPVLNGGELSVQVRANSNDDQGEQGDQPVVVTLVTSNARWSEVPDACESGDITDYTLTCDLGNVDFGTAVQFTAPLNAEGSNGDVINTYVELNGERIDLEPITIETIQGVDLESDYASATRYKVSERSAKVRFLFPFTVSVPVGGETLDAPIEFDIEVVDGNSSQDAAQILKPVFHEDTKTGFSGECGYFSINAGSDTRLPAAIGSDGDQEPIQCEITDVGNGTYHVVVTDFMSSLANRVDVNANGSALVRDDIVVVRGAVAFENNAPMFDSTESAFTGSMVTSNLQVQTSSGTPLADSIPDNQTTNFTIPLGGNWSASFNRYNFADGSNFLGDSGQSWDAVAPVAYGSTYFAAVNDSRLVGATADDYTTAGNCLLWDESQVLDFDFNDTYSTSRTYVSWASQGHTGYETDNIEYLYLSSAPSDASLLDSCGDKNWSSVAPTEATFDSVYGIKFDWDADDIFHRGNQFPTTQRISLYAYLTPRADMEIGDYGWMSAQRMVDGEWVNAYSNTLLQPVNGEYFDGTHNGLDLVTLYGGSSYANKSVTPDGSITIGDIASWTVTGGFRAVDGTGGTVTMTDSVPHGLEVVEDSISGGGVYDADARTITWTITQAEANTDYVFTYDTIMRSINIQRNNLLVDTDSPGVPDEARYSTARARAVAVPVALGSTVLTKRTVAPEFAINGSNAWLLTLTNRDADQDVWDVIDILPYNGDPRDTDYDGSVAYQAVTASDPNAEVYYTNADPDTIPSDPEDPANGAMGSVANNTVGWTTDVLSDATAVRVMGTNLASGNEVEITIPYSTDGNFSGNLYDNIAFARATTTELQMIRADEAGLAAPKAPIQIDKSLVEGDFRPGGTITYTIEVKNPDDNPINAVEVTDVGGVNLVEGSAVFSDESQGTSDGPRWAVGTLDGGESATATVEVQFTEDADFQVETVNAAIVSSPDWPKLDSSECINNVDVDSDTDQCDFVEAIENAELRVNKSVDKQPLIQGGTVTYTIEATNNGPDAASFVEIVDTPLDGLADATIMEPSKGEIVDGVWEVGTLEPEEVVTATVEATIADDADLTQPLWNAVDVSNPSNPADVDPDVPGAEQPSQTNEDLAGDTDQVDRVELVENSELRVNKAVEKQPLTQGGTVTYTIEATNNGPDAANFVEIVDTPLDGLADATIMEPSKGEIVDGVWEVGTLEPEEVVTATVEATIADDADLTQPLWNAVDVSNPSNPADVDPDVPGAEQPSQTNEDLADDTDQVDRVELVENSELRVNKAVEKQPLTQGGTVTYTIEATNNGPDAANFVEIVDTPLDGLADATIMEPSKGEIVDGVWEVGTLEPEEVVTATVEATIADDADLTQPLWNAVDVSNPSNPADVDPDVPGAEQPSQTNEDLAGDIDQVDRVVLAEDSELRVNKEAVSVENGIITYAVEATNVGPDTAYHVVVTDTPVSGLSGVEFTEVSQGTFDEVLWSVGTLEPGQVVTATVTATLEGPSLNSVTVTSPVHPVFGDAPNDTLDGDDDQYDEVPYEPASGLIDAGDPSHQAANIGLIIAGLITIAGAAVAARRVEQRA